MTARRFRWRRGEGDGPESYHAHLGRFHVGQIVAESGHSGEIVRWRWRIPFESANAERSNGRSRIAREAATALEAAFTPFVLTEPRFALRLEDEEMLRAVLQLPPSAQLVYELAVQRGEHVRPISPADEGGWWRWLAEERRRGTRHWISPEDMRDWFGEAWQDPRQAGR